MAANGNATKILGNLITGTTGTTSTNLVYSTSPTLITPALGTPSALVLTNATGLPIAGITGLGTGVGTALAVNIGSAGAFITFNGALGTPSSGTATNLTGTASGLTAGAVTNATLTTALTVNTGTLTLTANAANTSVLTIGAGAVSVSGSNTGDQTNISGNAATVTTNANLTGSITSVGNATSIASQTGTGTKFVVDTSPTLVTPVLGVATATSINKVTITAPATSSTLTVADGSSLITSGAFALTLTSTATSNATIPAGTNTLYSTLSGSITSAQMLASMSDETGTGALVFGTTPTFTTSMLLSSGFVMNWNASNVVLTHSSAVLTLGTGDFRVTNAGSNTASVVTLGGTQTITAKRITKRTGTVASSGTPTINSDTVDFFSITALAVAITSFTTNLSGTPTDAQTLWIAITDNGTARALAWGTSFEASTVALPTTTVISTRLDVGFVWNTVTSKWRCVAAA